jgi:hypothetical protein
LDQIVLIDGDFTGVELCDSIRVDVGADDIVARLGEAGAGDQAYVTTSNDTKIQGASPVNDAAMDF